MSSLCIHPPARGSLCARCNPENSEWNRTHCACEASSKSRTLCCRGTSLASISRLACASERARERERERLTQRRQRSAAAAQAWPLSRALGLRLRIFACPRAKSLGAGTSKPLGMLARISDGPGAARRQPVPLSHPFHINPASPSQPQTPINQTTQHRQARAHAHMRTRAPTRCVRAAPNQAMRTRAPTRCVRAAPNQALGARKPHLDGLFRCRPCGSGQVRCGRPGGTGTGGSSGAETRPTCKAQNWGSSHALGRPWAQDISRRTSIRWRKMRSRCS